MRTTLSLVLFFTCFLHVSAAPAKPLQTFKDCTFVPTEWADGDSFRIKTATDQEHTIRLYGADCMEWHLSSESDERRLRTQRRYFGITGPPMKARESIDLAKGFGKQAMEKTAALLAKPFTIHTRFRDALGDGKNSRIYAFVETADGTDLATALVKSGLARAHGVYADGPDPRTAEEYEKQLDDLELQASKLGTGIWAKTDWVKLPAERQAQREDDIQINLALGKQTPPAEFKLNPNTAARDELMKLPGVGEEIANRIIQKQPYQKPEDLLEVPGIGPKKLEEIRPFLEFPNP